MKCFEFKAMTLEGRGLRSEFNITPGLTFWKETEAVTPFHLAGSSSASNFFFFNGKKISSLWKKRELMVKFTTVFSSLSFTYQVTSNPPLIIVSNKLLISKYFISCINGLRAGEGVIWLVTSNHI